MIQPNKIPAEIVPFCPGRRIRAATEQGSEGEIFSVVVYLILTIVNQNTHIQVMEDIMNNLQLIRRCMSTLGIAITLAGISVNTVTAQERTEAEETVIKTDEAGDTTVSSVTKITTSNTEDIRELKHMILVNPIKFIYVFNAAYFRGISEDMAIGLTLQTPTALIDEEASGFGLSGDFVYYPSKKLYRGFHVGGNAAFDVVSYSSWVYTAGGGEVQEFSETPYSLGGYIGWNWWWGKEFVTDFTLGAEYNFNPTKEAVLSPVGDRKGVVPYLAIRIGHAW